VKFCSATRYLRFACYRRSLARAIVALTGLIARELGGCRWAIVLACAATLCALFHLAVGNFFPGRRTLEHAFAARFQWFKPVLLGAILAIGALIAPLAVPILTPDSLSKRAATITNR
jgi:hypothetical protein